VDITIYLPDDIAQRAKKQNVNLSRLLRDALVEKFRVEDIMAETLEGASEIKLKLENENGRMYTGRITGKMIASGNRVEVYLTEDERVIVYDFDNLKYWVEDWETDLEALIGDRDVYVEAMDALGREVTIDI
jgi:post-segregation antitoxin (ccd killing protein)